jgi:hypothetical protein
VSDIDSAWSEDRPARPDIFISYSWEDDAAPPDQPSSSGFVSYLYERFRYNFKMLGPMRPVLWREKSRIADPMFDAETDQALKSARLLLVVLSPNWMASQYCRAQLDEFARSRRDRGMTDEKIATRIVVVKRLMVKPEHRPHECSPPCLQRAKSSER